MRTQRHIEFDLNPMDVPSVAEHYRMITAYAEQYMNSARYNGDSVAAFVQQAAIDVYPAAEHGFAHKRNMLRDDLRQEIARLDRRERRAA